MASITIRQLDESIKQKMCLRAKENGRSIEAEARAILTEALTEGKAESKGLASMIMDITKAHAVDNEGFPLPKRKYP